MQTAKARPAQFDRASQNSRSMLAKIHVAKKQLNMMEDDYRQLLFDTTGQLSLTKCNERQLIKVLDVLKAKGFRPLPGKGRADHPMARKARALWISLYHLGVVHNPADEALEAFAKRQLKCDRLQWARQSDAYQLIEALKDMAERNGWPQSRRGGDPVGPHWLQASLCQAILQKLKDARLIPVDWALHMAVWRLLGIAQDKTDPWTAEDYTRVAGQLGQILRERGGQS